MNAQNVFLWAVNDDRAEGTRVVTTSHSVLQPSCDPTDLKDCYDGAIVRNVEATIYDNDQPDVIVTQLDPNTNMPDNNSTVLEGWGSNDPGFASDHRAARQVRDLARERADGAGGRRHHPERRPDLPQRRQL